MGLRRGLAAAGAWGVLATASAAAAVPIQPIPVHGGGTPPASARLSSTAAGARPVELTVQVRYEMVCGQPGTGTVVVTLPAAARVPAAIDASSLLVNSRPPTSVAVADRSVTVGLPHRKPGVLCDVVAPGTLTVVFTRRAGLGNPAAAGTYSIAVRRANLSFATTVRISS
jgi:hypothetical protein